jgi:sugar lactone lactonase YvrE
LTLTLDLASRVGPQSYSSPSFLRGLMRLSLMVLLTTLPASVWGQEASPFGEPLRTIDSIPAPESVAVGPDGAWYVSSFGKFDNGADGAVYRVDPDKGTREIYAAGLEDPCGVLFVGNTLWASDRKGVYRVTRGKVELAYPAKDFPRKLHFLNDLAANRAGTLYVSDTGDSTASGHGAVFALAAGKRPALLRGSDTVNAQSSANGLFHGGGDTLYIVGYRTGVLSVTDGHGGWREIARGLGSPDGIAAAGQAGFYVSDNVGGDLFLVPRAGGKPVKLAGGLKSPADLIVDHRRGLLVVPENSGNRLSVYRISAIR